MKIVVSGPAEAFSSDTEEQVTDPNRLKKLDGLAYSKDRCSNYIDRSLQDIGVTGGVILLAFDAKTKRLRVRTEYHAPRKLTAEELKLLVKKTTGQWSDGIGEGDFLHQKKLKMDVDLLAAGVEEGQRRAGRRRQEVQDAARRRIDQGDPRQEDCGSEAAHR